MSDDREFVADPIIDEHFSHRTGPSALSSQTTTLKETAMAQQGVMTGKPSIESDRVEGTSVYDPQGNDIGGIKRLLIEKTSGRVAYSVMSFGGFLGMGEEEHAVPWSKLWSASAPSLSRHVPDLQFASERRALRPRAQRPDCLADDAVHREPVSAPNSLANREINREFC
jgi:PRC-barrel domain